MIAVAGLCGLMGLGLLVAAVHHKHLLPWSVGCLALWMILGLWFG